MHRKRFQQEAQRAYRKYKKHFRDTNFYQKYPYEKFKYLNQYVAIGWENASTQPLGSVDQENPTTGVLTFSNGFTEILQIKK